MMIRLLLFLYVLYSPLLFAAKAVCTVKNLQTNQIFQAIDAKRSYSVAKKGASEYALYQCASRSLKSQYCCLTSCYRR